MLGSFGAELKTANEGKRRCYKGCHHNKEVQERPRPLPDGLSLRHAGQYNRTHRLTPAARPRERRSDEGLGFIRL